MTRNAYTWLKNFEKRFPNHIIEMEWRRASESGDLKIRPKKDLSNVKHIDMMYSAPEKKFMFFDKETGKRIDKLYKIVRGLK